jgi:adenosylhomocysteine nucleosidase
VKKNNEGRLINIVTALHSEAQPLIQHFGLKKDPRFTLLEFFQNDHVALVVSGIGKVRSAIATTLLLNQNAGGIAVNFGVCGSPEKKNNIGDLFLVNKITDHASGREYFPDVIYKHEFQESSL